MKNGKFKSLLILFLIALASYIIVWAIQRAFLDTELDPPIDAYTQEAIRATATPTSTQAPSGTAVDTSTPYPTRVIDIETIPPTIHILIGPPVLRP